MSRRPYRVSHILFDVDGTLVDFESAMWHALRATAERASEVTGTLVTPEHLQEGRNRVAVEPSWKGQPLLEVRVEGFRRILAAAGHDRVETAQELSQIFVQAREEVLTIYPDAEEALPELHARGFSLVAATNGNIFLERRPIARYLSHIHRADDVGVSKPDPRFFRLALERVGARPSEALTVGDCIDNDIEPARQLGMPGILIDREGLAMQDPTVHRIEALTELVDVIELAASEG